MGNWKGTEVYKTIHLAIPIIMGELAQMSLHLIDTAMVGAISYKHLAAASLVMTAANIPFVIGIGMTISVSQMVSMANGRRDHQWFRTIFQWLYTVYCFCVAHFRWIGFEGIF
jgi:MATE family multidrug resistance protein